MYIQGVFKMRGFYYQLRNFVTTFCFLGLDSMFLYHMFAAVIVKHVTVNQLVNALVPVFH
jgi:hypothetical protein